MEFFLVAAVLGIIPALIAQSKGRSFIAWWLYGFLLFIIALVHSLVIKKDAKVAEQEMIADGMRKCPFCAEMVRKEAVKCKHCGSDLTPSNEVPKVVVPVKETMNPKFWDAGFYIINDANESYVDEKSVKQFTDELKLVNIDVSSNMILRKYRDEIEELKESFPGSLQLDFERLLYKNM